MTLNRHQNRFDLYFADPRSTVCKLAVRDESGTYIRENVFDNIIFYPETFSFVSERNGYNHLYWYNITEILSNRSLPAHTKYWISWVMTLKTEIFITAATKKVRCAALSTR